MEFVRVCEWQGVAGEYSDIGAVRRRPRVYTAAAPRARTWRLATVLSRWWASRRSDMLASLWARVACRGDGVAVDAGAVSMLRL
jgi:hypothetical protein